MSWQSCWRCGRRGWLCSYVWNIYHDAYECENERACSERVLER